MYFFILHLSIADVLTAFLTLLPELVWTFTYPRFYGGNLVCKAVKYAQVLGPYLSSYTLVMTAVDRYQVTRLNNLNMLNNLNNLNTLKYLKLVMFYVVHVKYRVRQKSYTRSFSPSVITLQRGV
jgi:hypothetical protein